MRFARPVLVVRNQSSWVLSWRMAASRAFSEVIFLSKSVMISNSFLGLEFNRQKKKALRVGRALGGLIFKFLPKEFFYDTENPDHNYDRRYILLLR